VLYLVHQFLERSARDFPRSQALVYGRERLSYEQVWDGARAVSRALMGQGLQKGDRIAVYLEKSPQEIMSLYGASLAGGVFVILHPSLTHTQAAYVLRQSGARYLLTDPSKAGLLENSFKSLRALSKVLVWRKYRLSGAWQRKALKSAASKAGSDVLNGHDLATIIYTSGSTGQPKGVMLTHQNVTLSAHASTEYLENRPGDILMGTLPMSFDYGLVQLMSAFKFGGSLILKSFLSGEDLMSTAFREKVNGLGGIPTMLIPASESRILQNRKFRHLRYITNSGGRLPVSCFRRLQKLLPRTQIYSMYGFTEAFRASYLDPARLHARPDSIGKAIPNARLYVLDEKGRECRAGQIGELVQAGPLVSRGYWRDPDETAKKIRQNPLHDHYADPVCYSGDWVKKDREGYLYFVGRKDQMIKSSGFRISPDEIESVLCRHRGVQSAAAVGIADEVLGQRIKVSLVMKKGFLRKEEEIRRHCQKYLPAYMQPHGIQFLGKMPLTAHGKIHRGLLAGRKA